MVQGQPWLVSDMSLLPCAQGVKTRASGTWSVFKRAAGQVRRNLLGLPVIVVWPFVLNYMVINKLISALGT